MFISFFKNKKSKQKGFSLVEMIIYIAITSLVMIVIVDVILTVSRSNKQSVVYNNVKNSAISSLEKIVRETRSSISIDVGQSVFDSEDGALFLNSKDQNGDPKTIKFYIENDLLVVDVNGARFGPLTTNGTKVSGIIFNLFDTGNSKAVKIKIGIEGEKNGFTKNEDFYSTVVLRGSY